MAKTVLFDLIKSMTMSEKRYFKVRATNHVLGESNDYISLFDAIDSMKAYDEDKLRSQKFVKNISAEKNYLYRLILKSLNQFHADASVKAKLYQLLQNIEVLYQKGLYDQAIKLVNKADKLAEQNELFAQHLSVKEIEFELRSKKFEYSTAERVLGDAKVIANQLGELNKIQALASELYELRLGLGASRSKEDVNAFEKIVTKKNKLSDSKFSRFELYQNGIDLTYLNFRGDIKKELPVAERMTILYESNPHLIEFSILGYVSSLFNLINIYKESGKPKLADQALDKLEACLNKTEVKSSNATSARVLLYVSILRLEQFLKGNKFTAAKHWMIKQNVELEKLSHFIAKPQLYQFRFLTAKTHFVNGDYRFALKDTLEVINDTKFKSREDLLSAVRLLNIMTHFELNNDLTVEYVSEQVAGYLKKKKRYFKLENELIRFIQNRNLVSKDEKLKDFKQLKQRMKEIRKDPFEQMPFEYFDFEVWATYKIEGKTLSKLSVD